MMSKQGSADLTKLNARGSQLKVLRLRLARRDRTYTRIEERSSCGEARIGYSRSPARFLPDHYPTQSIH
jgi:rRNA maturation protein Nop10